jgi:hypothetical protein
MPLNWWGRAGHDALESAVSCLSNATILGLISQVHNGIK